MVKTFKRSLKFKIMAMGIGLTVVLGGMAIVGVNYLGNLQAASSLKSFDAWSAALEDGLTAQFYERYGDVQAFAVSPALRVPDRASIVASLNVFAALYGIYDLILVVDLRGNLVAVNSHAPDGKPIASEVLYQRSYADAPWFKAVISNRTTDEPSKALAATFVEEIGDDALVSQVYGGKRQGNSFSSAIRDADGKIIGVVSNRTQAWYQVAFANAYALIKATNLPGTVLMLLNKSGHILYEFGGSDAVNAARTNLVVDFATQTAAGAIDNQIALAADGSEHAISLRPVGGPKFTSPLHWYVVSQNSLAEVVAQDAAVKRTFFGLIGVALVVCAGLCYAFSASLARQLIALAEQLSASTSEVSAAAVHIFSSSTELSQAATEQASAIQQTASAIDEVSAMAKKSADNALLSQKSSMNSRQAAEKGQEAAQEMIRAISAISESNGNINAQVEEGNRQISDIVKVIGEIGTKTKVINDIVFQTKLLSFNASVEAARAGEHGKGFAVVAEEVGNLAQMSGNAAKEISTMLDSSIQKVESIVSQTRSRVEKLVATGNSRVETGTKVAGACGETLTKLLGLVQEVEGMVAEIASASAEQSQGVTEINKAMNSLDQVTHKNSAVAQRAAQQSEQLTRQSTDLRQSIADLSILVQGDKVPAAQFEGVSASHLAAPQTTRHVPVVVPPKKTATGNNKAVLKAAPQPPWKKPAGPGSQGSNVVSSPKLKSEPKFHDDNAGMPAMDDPRFKDV